MAKMTNDDGKQKSNESHTNNNDVEFREAAEQIDPNIDGGYGWVVVFGCFFIHIISKIWK